VFPKTMFDVGALFVFKGRTVEIENEVSPVSVYKHRPFVPIGIEESQCDSWADSLRDSG